MIRKELKGIYVFAWCIIIFFTAGMFAVYMLHHFIRPVWMEASKGLSVAGLMGSVVGTLALPILTRTMFYKKCVKNKGLLPADFFHMELIILISVLAGCIFVLFSYFAPIYRYHLYLSVFAGIYGLYTVFPSDKIYNKDIKAFRVKYNENQ